MPFQFSHLTRFAFMFCCGLLMTACADADTALPTQIQLDTPDAPSITPTFTTPEAVSARPTLPPTFTPTPTSTPDSGPEPADSESGQAPVDLQGVIYYIYNGDSIIRMNDDGRDSELIVTFGVGAPIRELTLSPDATMLAFVAPGAGSAMEVYISSLDGVHVQRISCLGFADIRSITWHANSQTLAFIGAQSPGGAADIYRADWAGSNTCPDGNNQQRLTERTSTTLTSVAFNPHTDQIFFADPELYALDLSSGQISPALSFARAAAPDFGLRFNPARASLLAYLRRTTPSDAEPRGTGVVVDASSTSGPPPPLAEIGEGIAHMSWSRNGEKLLLTGDMRIELLNLSTRVSSVLVEGEPVPSGAAFNATGNDFIYVGIDPELPEVHQIYRASASTGAAVPLTFHMEGTASDLVWLDR